MLQDGFLENLKILKMLKSDNDYQVMIFNKTVQKIIRIAINAPSGSNSQPWKFCVSGNSIDVIALPERDHPILNFRNRGTWVAHGALIENIAISAPAFGYKSRVVLFPDENDKNITARITLDRARKFKDPLFSAIPYRATNRKPYASLPLTIIQKEELMRSEKEVGGGKLFFVEGNEKLSILGRAVSANEIVMMEDKALHKLFFDEIVWTKDEERRKKSGLYLKTMELKPLQEKALNLLKYWPVMNLLNKLGFAKKIASDNTKTYASASLGGIIAIEKKDEAFLEAGRLMERIWLKVTKMGLSFHLITGVLFLWQRINEEDSFVFSPKHSSLIKKNYSEIESSFNVPRDKIIALFFRVGRSDPPTAFSSKKDPVVDFV